MTADELKTLLSTPAALFLVMLLGSLASMLKQLSDARKNGSGASLGSYLAHLPETAGTVITNALGFLTLVVTDQLNFASALGIGYAANSAADLLRTGGRSASLASKQGGFARITLLLAIAAMALVGLAACQTPPNKVIETACTPGTRYSVERCVKGIAETWETYQVRAEIIVADPLTPADVKAGVQRAEAASRPVVVDTLKAGAVYAEIKQQVAAGQAEAERLAIANANLEQWVAKALPLIRSFGDKLGR